MPCRPLTKEMLKMIHDKYGEEWPNMNKQICLNKSVLDFMDKVLTKESFVVEFGAGWSSRWLADRCGKLVTIETDPRWADRVATDLQGSDCDWDIRLSQGHVGILKDIHQCDLVLIDCHKSLRHSATTSVWSRVLPGGYLLFDDAQRPEHKKTVDWMQKWVHGCLRLEWQEGDLPSAKERLTLAWRK